MRTKSKFDQHFKVQFACLGSKVSYIHLLQISLVILLSSVAEDWKTLREILRNNWSKFLLQERNKNVSVFIYFSVRSKTLEELKRIINLIFSKPRSFNYLDRILQNTKFQVLKKLKSVITAVFFPFYWLINH